MAQNFGAYSSYYDLLYKDKDYSGEVSYIDQCIKKFHPQASDILELGSGTGAHGLLLAEKGYQVFGLERSESMVNVAQKKGFDCQVGDICDFNLQRTFDVSLSMFHVISYLTSNDQLIDTFKNVKKHLKNGGIFVFDAWYTDAVITQKAEPRIKELEDDRFKVIRIANPVKKGLENVIDVNYEILVEEKKTGLFTRIQEVHPMRYFSIPEIELIGRHTGLELVSAFDFGTFETPSSTSWGVNFVMRNNGR